MAHGVNKVMLVGRLGRDPEIRTTQKGTEVATFSLATGGEKKRQDGSSFNDTQWHNIVVWRKSLIELVRKCLKKGTQVYIEGRQETRSWKHDSGIDMRITEVVLRDFHGEICLCERAPGQASGPDDGAPPPDDQAQFEPGAMG